ncbi:MAG: imidazole glycerol phosphate synthase subunit HisF [Leptospirales bacterium]|nr:imidazole glycerol phosphate synthase subunit HisF [Leptospirales bacterium]
MENGFVLAIRVIPCLDIKDGRVVKGVQFLDLRDAGDPVEQAEYYASTGADELCFLDITATHEARDIIIDLVRRVAERIFIPFTVGGGIRTLADMDSILHAGADKVSLNTAAFERPEVLSEGARKFGSQCIVCAIDARKKGDDWEVFLSGGRKATGKSAIEWAREAESRGAGEILLTSMDRDGTRDGYDIELTRAIRSAVRIPVIASGGAGKASDLVDVAVGAHADAVLAASIFHFRDTTVRDVKMVLRENQIQVRL